MNFWRSFGFYPTKSAIDGILERDVFTLEELLDESDLISEVNAHNKTLLNFLCKPEVLARVVSYVVDDAPPSQTTATTTTSTSETTTDTNDAEATPTTTTTTEEAKESTDTTPTDGTPAITVTATPIEPKETTETKQQTETNNTDTNSDTDTAEAAAKLKKYKRTCSDLLCLEVWVIAESLWENDLVSRLCSFLDRPSPLPNLLAARCSRVVCAMLQHKPVNMLEHFKQHGSMVAAFVNHIGSTPVVELLFKLIAADSHVLAAGVSGGTVEFLKNGNLMRLLVDALTSDNDEKQEHSADLLVDIITSASQTEGRPSGQLVAQLEAKSITDDLYTRVLAQPNTDSPLVKHGLQVICALLSKPPPSLFDAEKPPPYVVGLQQHIPCLKQLLISSDSSKAWQATSGSTTPFGFVRLKILELFAAIAKLPYDTFVYHTLIDVGVLQSCLDMFFVYEWNNILQRTVTDIVLAALEGGDLVLKTSLFLECNLHETIAKGGLAGCGSDGSPRKAYMGFLTTIATAIEKEANEIETIAELLRDSKTWVSYVDGELSETKKVTQSDIPQPSTLELHFSTDEDEMDDQTNNSDSDDDDVIVHADVENGIVGGISVGVVGVNDCDDEDMVCTSPESDMVLEETIGENTTAQTVATTNNTEQPAEEDSLPTTNDSVREDGAVSPIALAEKVDSDVVAMDEG